MIEFWYNVQPDTQLSWLHKNNRGKLSAFIVDLFIKKYNRTLCDQKEFIHTLQLSWLLEYEFIDFQEL